MSRTGTSNRAVVVGSAVFTSKLRPPAHAGLLRRPRLLRLLDEVLTAPVTLVVAPAGSGKTSLLATWVADADVPSAWLDLDDADSDPVRLWTGLLAALGGLVPGVGTDAMALLGARADAEDVAAALIAELDDASVEAAVLVVDDTHLVRPGTESARALTAFAEHLPRWLHLVVIGREGIELPIARRRGQGSLGEVRYEELRFSEEESARLLTHLAPHLPAAGVARASHRSDGWAAALRLTALASRSAWARGKAGGPDDLGADEHLLKRYLRDEVLLSLSPGTLAALRAAAVVERIDGALAEAMTGDRAAGGLLDEAAERGLFLTRLDELGCHQLHALARELLLADLAATTPDLLRVLHSRAARWFDTRGEFVLGLQHWLEAGAFREALHSLYVHGTALYDSGHEETVARALARIPDDVIRADRTTELEYAWANVVVDSPTLLRTVDHLVQVPADDGPEIAGGLLVLRSIAAVHRGRWADCGTLAHEALTTLGPDATRDPLGRHGWNMVARSLALGEHWDDDSPAVRAARIGVGVDAPRRLALEATRAVGQVLAGRPLVALHAVAGVRRAVDQPMSILATEIALAEAMAYRELGDRERAIPLLTTVAERPVTPVPYAPLLARLELVAAHLAAGDDRTAAQDLAIAADLVREHLPGPGTHSWLRVVETSFAIATGDLPRARVAAAEVLDPFWAAVSRARLLLAEGDRAGAGAALADATPRTVRHRVVRGLLRGLAASDHERGQTAMGDALALAAEYGMLQTVAAKGTQVLDELELAASRVPAEWLDRVRRATLPKPVTDRRRAGMVEALTDRERDVLRMLPSRLTVREIADELGISTNTLKFHLKTIYRKLEVASRAEAAELARSMTRLGRDPGRP
jgi:LuxR family maltose regulon positive regulatory protein